jgi:hypothetical protein
MLSGLAQLPSCAAIISELEIPETWFEPPLTTSVFFSYRINNSYGCQNSYTLNYLLKNELGFQVRELMMESKTMSETTS